MPTYQKAIGTYQKAIGTYQKAIGTYQKAIANYPKTIGNCQKWKYPHQKAEIVLKWCLSPTILSTGRNLVALFII